MLHIDVSSDIDAAFRGVHDFWRGQLPFATSGALNDTAFDVRKHVVGSTYPKAFTVRNRAFPGRLWRVTKKANKRELQADITQTLDRDFLARHVSGGIKTGRTGGRVAVPTDPGSMRSANGRIKAGQKPRRLGEQKSVFTIKRGNKKFILRRGRNGAPNKLLYSIVPSAKIDRRLRFYEDAKSTGIRVFSGHWNTRMDRAIRSSRFFPG